MLVDIHDATAIEEATAAVDLARRAGDPRTLSTALAAHGRAAHQAGDLLAALADAEHALTLATHAGDHRATALRHRLADAVTADLNKVDDTLDQAEALLTDLDDQLGRARVLTARGDALISSGEYAQACDALAEALLVVERSANSRYIADVLNMLGRAAEAQGRRDAARDYYTRALAHYSTANHAHQAEGVQEQLDQLDR